MRKLFGFNKLFVFLFALTSSAATFASSPEFSQEILSQLREKLWTIVEAAAKISDFYLSDDLSYKEIQGSGVRTSGLHCPPPHADGALEGIYPPFMLRHTIFIRRRSPKDMFVTAVHESVHALLTAARQSVSFFSAYYAKRERVRTKRRKGRKGRKANRKKKDEFISAAEGVHYPALLLYRSLSLDSWSSDRQEIFTYFTEVLTKLAFYGSDFNLESSMGNYEEFVSAVLPQFKSGIRNLALELKKNFRTVVKYIVLGGRSELKDISASPNSPLYPFITTLRNIFPLASLIAEKKVPSECFGSTKPRVEETFQQNDVLPKRNLAESSVHEDIPDSSDSENSSDEESEDESDTEEDLAEIREQLISHSEKVEDPVGWLKSAVR